MSGIQAFLVDDDKDYSLLLKKELLEMKMISQVTYFESGITALAHLSRLIEERKPASEFPKLIILDLYLDGESGLQILGQLKMSEHTKNIPVIINTAAEEKNDLVEVYKKGGAVFVPKQANNHFLQEALKQLKLTGRI